MCGIYCALSSSQTSFDCLSHRGPDESASTTVDNVFLGFHHLAIVHPTTSNQPLSIDGIYLICNGEIYNSEQLHIQFSLPQTTGSDCEIIIQLYRVIGIHRTLRLLNGEFAFVLYDSNAHQLYAARDLYGVRPLFYGYQDDSFFFASEMKAISFVEGQVQQFRPGIVMVINTNDLSVMDLYPYKTGINSKLPHLPLHRLLEYTVHTYLQSDRPIGSFLSGGLDSSLITALLFKQYPALQCFSIGMRGSVDVVAAKKVAEYIGLPPNRHHIVEMTVEDGLDVLHDVIRTLETYDITTIRASIPQYLLARYIAQNTDVKVLFSGEGADELFAGYQYSKNAPDAAALERDTYRLLSELCYFDNLRTDRTTARWGLEVRVPFLNKYVVNTVLSYPSEERMCNQGKMEKRLLRDAFQNEHLLPHEILYRRKEAFSDAVSSPESSWFHHLQAYIDTQVSDAEFEEQRGLVKHNPPPTKEAYYYRKVFDEMYPNREYILPHYWMPQWCGEVTDPSATILSCYEN